MSSIESGFMDPLWPWWAMFLWPTVRVPPSRRAWAANGINSDRPPTRHHSWVWRLSWDVSERTDNSSKGKYFFVFVILYHRRLAHHLRRENYHEYFFTVKVRFATDNFLIGHWFILVGLFAYPWLVFMGSYANWRETNYLNRHFKLFLQKQQQSIRQRSSFANDEEANTHKS